MKSRFFLIAFFSMIGKIAFAQPAVLWEQHYNGPPDQGDEAVSIAVDASGNSYVTGSAFALNGTYDIVTIKYDAAGQQLWLQSYNGTANDNDQGKKLVIDAAGNVYVTGFCKGSTTGNDIITIKYNNSGAQQWVKIYNGPFNALDEGASLAVDANGNVFVTGFETTANQNYFDLVTIMYNSAGVQQWAHSYDGPGSANDVGVDIVNDGAGNTYVVGTSDTMYMSAPNNDIVLLKYNNAGTLQWRSVFWSSTYSYDIARKMCLDRNGNILVCGYGGLVNEGNNYYIIKFNAAGSGLWYHYYNYGPNTYEQPWAIVADSLNNVIVTGQGISSTATQTNDYVTVKYTSGGTFQWAARYNGPASNHDYAYAVALDDSLNIFVTGTSKGTGTQYDIATVKYDAAGNEKYVLRYDNNPAHKDDAGNAIALHNGNIYITGRSSNLTNDDYITLCYTYSAVGIHEHENVPVLLNAFPNPASGEVHISVPTDLGSAQAAYSFVITNTLGQDVKKGTALPTESIGTETSLQVSTSGLGSGSYFVTIYEGEKVAGKAKIIVK